MPTGAAEFIDATTAAVFIPTIYSKEAIVAREEELVLAKLVDRRFEEEAEFGDTIRVPSVSNLSAQVKDRSLNAALVFETVTETNTTITISTWEYSAIALETATKRQANRDLLRMYAPKQGYALAHSVDAALAALIDDFSQSVGVLAQDLTFADVLRARQYLDDANAPMRDRVIVVSPAQEAGFINLPQFIHTDYSKLQGDLDLKGQSQIGTWMGMPVYKSTNVEGTNAIGHDNGMFQKEAIALVMQMNAETHVMFDINYLAKKVVVEQLYGLAEMRDDHGVWMKGA